MLLHIEQAEEWIDDELAEKFRELDDAELGKPVSPEAQKAMIDFCGDDTDKLHQLRVWIFWCHDMTLKATVPTLTRWCERSEIIKLTDPAQKRRARSNPVVDSHKRMTKVN